MLCLSSSWLSLICTLFILIWQIPSDLYVCVLPVYFLSVPLALSSTRAVILFAVPAECMAQRENSE